jgi:probable rRNA maturation factor
MSVPTVQVEDRSDSPIDIDRAAGLAVALLARLGYTGGELGVTYVSAEEISELNSEYIGRTGATDVLSFPLDAGAMEVEAGFLAELEAEEQAILGELIHERGSGSDEVPLLLGDVVICPEVAAMQASAHGHSLERELCLLLVHGVLHIAGFDHESDTGEMEQLQERLLAEMCPGR